MTLYSILKELHAYNRYLILIALVAALFRAYNGWLNKRPYGKPDSTGGLVLMILADVQLLVGLVLYWLSPYGLPAFSSGAASERGSWASYFAKEHIGAMILAILCIHLGRSLAKKAGDAVRQHRYMAIYLTVAILLIIGTLAHKGLVLARLADAAVGQ